MTDEAGGAIPEPAGGAQAADAGGSQQPAPDQGAADTGRAAGARSPFDRMPTRRLLVVASGLMAVGGIGGIAAAVTASPAKGRPAAHGVGGKAAPVAAAPPPTLTTVPADGAANVDPSKPVTVSVANGTITSVELSGGQTTTGTLSDDRATWTSNGALAVATGYRLQVQASGKDGKTVAATASFSTLKPTATLGVLAMWPDDGSSVGVGQPVRVQFTNYVPQQYRAAIEKACVVTTTPAVPGAWNWVDHGTMDWRPRDYWPTGTQVSVKLALAGVKAGAHQYLVRDHSLDFTIRDTDLRLAVDAKAFRATAYQNGQVVRTFAIDTGTNDPRFITWSGVMVVLGKGNPVEMKGDYGNGDKYDELVSWATQITYSGTYVHAAPWDGQIGRVNSSHGCIHASTADATWFYNLARVGDVVQVTGTDKAVAITNGFGDWSRDWPSWLSGSAYGATLGGKPVRA